MVIHVNSLTFNGVNIVDVDVQVHLSKGIPSFTIVGLADKTIGESRERVRAAIGSLALSLPSEKILVNLAPADLIKEGSHFDLAIAIGILTAMNILPKEEMQEYLILGELSLDGTIMPVSGVLPAAIGASERNKGLICAYDNGSEAAWSGNSNIIAPKNLLSLINHFKGIQIISPPSPKVQEDNPNYADFSDIAGQDNAKRALILAASGGHNLLMIGPPGTGKSMLASRLPGILPDMSAKEILECSTISSVAGLISDGKLTKARPFRAPHHSCSMAAMVGGGVGKRIKPGEISLAHNGVLFLDEFPEFPQTVIDALRQPIETGDILISRANAHVKFPANFQLIAAMNPCRCGYMMDEDKACHKVPRCGEDYQKKVSGPIMDRFDIHIDVPNISQTELINYSEKGKSETSLVIAERVKKARELQLERYDGYGIKTNSELEGKLLTEFAFPRDGGIDLINKAAEKFKLSMRAYNRLLKLARTIADFEESKMVEKFHIAEALNFRKLENSLGKC